MTDEKPQLGIFFEKLEEGSKCVRCGAMTAADVIICSNCAKRRGANT